MNSVLPKILQYVKIEFSPLEFFGMKHAFNKSETQAWVIIAVLKLTVEN